MAEETELPPWPRERHTAPTDLSVDRSGVSGRFAYIVDPDQVLPGSEDVPLAAMVGCYLLGPDGRPTGEFLRNPDHVPSCDQVGLLDDPARHLEWLGDPPSALVRDILQELLGALELVRVHVVDGPRTAMRGEPLAEQPDLSHLADRKQPGGSRWNPFRRDRRDRAETTLQAVMLTDAGLATTVTLWARDLDGAGHLIHGVLTLVRTHLSTDDPGGAAWLEPEVTLDQAEARLEARIDEARAGHEER